MVELSDILQCCGRPLICDYLLNDVRNNEKENILTRMRSDEMLEIDTSPTGNFPVYNIVKAYTFKFVPVDLVEEKMMMEGSIKHLRSVQPKLMTIQRSERIDKIIARMEDNYYKLRDRCAGEEIINCSCFMLTYDDGKLINIHVAVPRLIINKVFLGTQEYQCSDCNNVIIAKNNAYDEFMPDMYYRVENGELKYYCNKCKEKYIHLKHIGE
jgi:hypothetical protein